MFFTVLAAILIILVLLYFYKNEIEVKVMYSAKPSKKGLRIGIVSDWHRKGVPYQSRFLSKCLSDKHDVHIFAYNEYVKDESDCGYKKLSFTKLIKPWKVIGWIKKEGLRVVFFPDRLEDAKVLEWCKKNGVATVMVINYETIKPQEFAQYKRNTVLLCPVKCTYDLLKKNGFANIAFIRWGVDTDIFSPKVIKAGQKVKFLHNAGYGGTEWRKNTLAVVDAFHIATQKNKNIVLILKSQRPISEYPERIRGIIKRDDRMIVVESNLEMKELIKLYRSAHVSLLPSKWEGIGIPFIESLALGLPVITTDAPPMNEWVKNNYNGLTAKVERWEQRNDKQLIVKGALVDTLDLSKKILKLAEPKVISRLSKNASHGVKNIKKEFRSKIERLIKSL